MRSNLTTGIWSKKRVEIGAMKDTSYFPYSIKGGEKTGESLVLVDNAQVFPRLYICGCGFLQKIHLFLVENTSIGFSTSCQYLDPFTGSDLESMIDGKSSNFAVERSSIKTRSDLHSSSSGFLLLGVCW